MPTTLSLNDYTRNDEDLRGITGRQAITADLAAIDAFAAHVTASFVTTFHYSGSAADLLTGDFGSAHYATADRIVTNVVCWAATSGSGGVTTIDVQKQLGAGLGFASLFSGSAVARPALSASVGNYGIVSTTSFVSGTSPIWSAGTLMRSVVLSAAGGTGLNGQKGLTVQVFWAPSGSYGV